MRNDPHVDISGIIYGPVESKRHGRSLGINVGLPHAKICTWSCLYCQCGFGERRDFLSTDERYDAGTIISALENYLKKDLSITTITLAGNTEPGTHPEIANIIQGMIQLRASLKQKWKINILSNGSELNRSDVVDAFNAADEAWIKLDVANEEKFRTLNRPLNRTGNLNDHIERMTRLKNLRIQTLLWCHKSDAKLANYSQEDLDDLKFLYQKLKPLAVNITTISRTPAFSELISADFKEVRFIRFLNELTVLGIKVNAA